MNVKWTALLVLTASLCYGMTLTPISFNLTNQGDVLTQWELRVDVDQNVATWEIVVRGVLIDGYTVLPPTTPDMLDGWGQPIGMCRTSFPLTVTVMVPLGGSTTWKAVGWSEGRVVCQSMGTIQAGPFLENDDAAAAWCVTGPGVRPWAGCLVFDEDTDSDVDLEDWALRFRPHAAPMIDAIDWPLCMSGPGVTADPECLRLDRDDDQDVDLKDWSLR